MMQGAERAALEDLVKFKFTLRPLGLNANYISIVFSRGIMVNTHQL